MTFINFQNDFHPIDATTKVDAPTTFYLINLKLVLFLLHKIGQ